METNVEPTREGIAKFIVQRACEIWHEYKHPYLLSNISPELKLRGVNYKEILGRDTTLKQFVGTLGEDVRVVVHPLQKAKIGIVPKESAFVFEVRPTVGSSAPTSAPPKRARHPSQRHVVLHFLAALSRLSDEELKSVNIPTSVLAKLMEEK